MLGTHQQTEPRTDVYKHRYRRYTDLTAFKQRYDVGMMRLDIATQNGTKATEVHLNDMI